jgi:hypothetical protein
LGAVKLPIVDIPGQMDLFDPKCDKKLDGVSPVVALQAMQVAGGDDAGAQAGVPVTESAEMFLDRINKSSVFEEFSAEPPSDKLQHRINNIPAELASNKSWLSMLITPKKDKGGFENRVSQDSHRHPVMGREWPRGWSLLCHGGQRRLCLHRSG